MKTMKQIFKNLFCNFLRKQHGLAAVEFAISLPLLIIISLGGMEATRYVFITQKLERVSISLSDIVAQSETMSVAQLNQIIGAASQVMLPYEFAEDGYAIISSVSKTGTNQPVINWQYVSGGTTQTSQIGVTGGNAIMPPSFTMIDKDVVIITEVFFNYNPMLPSIIYSNSQIYRYSIYKPRLGNLTILSRILPNFISRG